MTNYFAVYNNNSKLLLNDTYQNLYVSRKIPVSNAGTYSGTFATGEILAAVGGTESKSIDAYCQNLGTGYNCVVKTPVSGMQIYVFTVNRPARNSGLGMQLFNSAGKTIFDSLDPHPKITAFGNNTGVVTVGNKPAIAVAPNFTYLTNTLSASYDSYRYAISEWIPDQWGYVMVYNPPGTIPSIEYKYQIVTPAHWENVWHTKYLAYAYLTSTKEYKNFKLSGSSIEEVVVSTSSTTTLYDSMQWDDSDRAAYQWGQLQMDIFTRGNDRAYKTIIKTQSYLLLDVDGM